ncbi:hypothetical protein [Bdellovibrio sp. HCB288]|uniref:hypothetical protein n=1 Tax=Bdellovibrio sp. HCB288 TaxID=3394355 RepID=UPI0039B394D3
MKNPESLESEIRRLKFANTVQRDIINAQRKQIEQLKRNDLPEDLSTRKKAFQQDIHNSKKNSKIA